ncbi:hypothetical protein DDE82_006269 [Stemphylium lycopersici]|uniref:Uncharacterized protein n=1 Tax=Stemphylium lycopersici TaxID=183478 RepID=A0A364MXU0_STELY|nr:hypothetical protein DDE82_006269 [Stemphylium lycopersici]RAR06629.1 hypothetical protein DDE83_006857 [Stemphylium lycopersici]
MTDFNETRSPLTNENVQAWARQNFAASFRALPRAARLQWIEFDESFTISRAIWRSLGRSTHKQLLVIGGYAPGPAGDDDEPIDRVTAHVHEDEAEVSFYRITELEDGSNELQSVNSTSTVAFHAPFCDVGDDTGGSKAIHRVSALILYYFLAAGHVKALSRTRSDPTMFTRNFRDACLWVQNEGERPLLPPTRKSEPSTPHSEKDTVTVRPKRSSTVSSTTRSVPEDLNYPPIKRAATDSVNVKIKRERDDDYPSSIPASAIRPKKHPRRTLSEQIIVPSKLQESMTTTSASTSNYHHSGTILSPRSPAPERVNRALTDRINHLKDENAGLKASVSSLETDKTDLQQRMAKESHAYRGLQIESDALKREAENMKREMNAIKERLESVEAAGDKMRVEMDRLTAMEDASKDLRKELKGEIDGLRGRVERSEKEAENAKEELLAVRRGLTKELGEAVKKWGA